MIVSNLMLALTLVGLFAWTAVALFVVLPRSMVSLDRYRLWQLRDDVVLDIIDGRIEDSEAARQLVGDIEIRIVRAREYTLARLLLVARHTYGKDIPEALRDKPIPHDDVAQFHEYLRRFHEINRKAVTSNTILGAVAWVAFEVAHRIGKTTAKRIRRRLEKAERNATRGGRSRGAGHSGLPAFAR